MSVSQIGREIEKKADEEASRIIADARQEADRIVGEANAKAQALRNEKIKALERVLDTEGKAELAVSRMERKGLLLKQKSEWARRVFDEAGKRLFGIAEKGGAEYREFLGNLILDGMKKTKGNRYIVQSNARDTEVIRKELKSISEKAAEMKKDKIELQTKTWDVILSGGVIVSTEDKTQYYNNTLEARLSQTQQSLSGEVYRIIFKGE